MLATFRGINPAALHALEIQFGTGVHQNILSSYFEYLGNCLTGQFGLTAQGVPVMTEITSKLPWTLGLVGVTTVIAFVIGTFAGMASAWRRGGRLDAILPPTLFIVSTVPVFFVGLLLIYVFAVKLNWLPLGSNYSYRGDADVVAVVHLGRDQARHSPRAQPGDRDRRPVGVLDAEQHDHDDLRGLREDGSRQGLSSRRIMFGYAGRNAILPNLTGFAMQLGYVLGGAIVIEYLFSYPGLGYLFYTATTDHDLPLMQGLFLVYTLAVLVCVLIADLVTAALDPRTRDA